jgi:hypothetical protein
MLVGPQPHQRLAMFMNDPGEVCFVACIAPRPVGLFAR